MADFHCLRWVHVSLGRHADGNDVFSHARNAGGQTKSWAGNTPRRSARCSGHTNINEKWKLHYWAKEPGFDGTPLKQAIKELGVLTTELRNYCPLQAFCDRACRGQATLSLTRSGRELRLGAAGWQRSTPVPTAYDDCRIVWVGIVVTANVPIPA